MEGGLQLSLQDSVGTREQRATEASYKVGRMLQRTAAAHLGRL